MLEFRFFQIWRFARLVGDRHGHQLRQVLSQEPRFRHPRTPLDHYGPAALSYEGEGIVQRSADAVLRHRLPQFPPDLDRPNRREPARSREYGPIQPSRV